MEHSHWRCVEGHGWIYYPGELFTTWYDLTQPARCIYPVGSFVGGKKVTAIEQLESQNSPLCVDCGYPINDEILIDTPDCPHGWVSLKDMPMADVKALFARTDNALTLDPPKE